MARRGAVPAAGEKPPRFNFDLKKAVAFMKKNKHRVAEFRRKMADDSVVSTTAKQYYETVNRIAVVMRLVRGLPRQAPGVFGDVKFDINDFVLYLEAVTAQKMAGATATNVRCAVLHWQHTVRFGLKPRDVVWADSPLAITLCKGLAYVGKDPERRRPVRGTLTRTMLLAVLQWCADTGCARVVPIIRVQWGMQARIGQVIGILAGDLTKGDDTILTRAEKKSTAGRPQFAVIGRKTIDKETAELVMHLQRGKRHGEPLFVKADGLRAGAAIKQAAHELGFPSCGLFYDGNHVVRHCATSARTAACKEAVKEIFEKSATGMEAKSTRRRYNRTNVERQQQR
jgi:hypothetical protein